MRQSNHQIRLFLVGCPRSGTTYLQSLLAAHSEILSFPESKFFRYLLPTNEPRRRWFGLVSRRLRGRLEVFFKDDLQRPDLLAKMPSLPLPTAWYTDRFVKLLDQLTKEADKSIWLEKTPEHITYIDYIEKTVPNAKFIHLLRDGTDVVASLYEVSHKYPKWWQGGFSIDHCIQRWTESVKISRQNLYKPNHHLVRYEALVADPRASLEKLCEFIEIPFEESMLTDFGKSAQQLVREASGRVVSQAPRKTGSKKFERVFDADQQTYIRQQLSDVQVADLVESLLAIAGTSTKNQQTAKEKTF